MQQTAIDWLLEQIEFNSQWYSYLGKQELKEQARQKFMNQIIEAHNTGTYLPYSDGMEYFKSTFETAHDKKNRL